METYHECKFGRTRKAVETLSRRRVFPQISFFSEFFCLWSEHGFFLKRETIAFDFFKAHLLLSLLCRFKKRRDIFCEPMRKNRQHAVPAEVMTFRKIRCRTTIFFYGTEFIICGTYPIWFITMQYSLK